MYRGGQLRGILEVSVTIIQQFRHLGPFTHPLMVKVKEGDLPANDDNKNASNNHWQWVGCTYLTMTAKMFVYPLFQRFQ